MQRGQVARANVATLLRAFTGQSPKGAGLFWPRAALLDRSQCSHCSFFAPYPEPKLESVTAGQPDIITL